MDMLGRLLAKIGFTVYIPRIPPLKNLDISEINIQWFICFYKWIINVKKVDPNKIIMIGISYGGAIMLRSIFEIKDKLPQPKTVITYGTYANGQTMLNFLLTGEITIDGEIHRVSPQEWGLVVIYHNYLKNLPTEWDSENLQKAIQLRIEEKIEECYMEVNHLPKFQKNILNSIFNRDLNPEVKELALSMIKREQQSLKKLSPIYWASQIQNKVFIIHGANDSMVPFTESIQLSEILPNSELFISHLYEHNEISTNKGQFFIFRELIRLIYFYAKLFSHHES
jgi:acetyl esterase/lipase